MSARRVERERERERGRLADPLREADGVGVGEARDRRVDSAVPPEGLAQPHRPKVGDARDADPDEPAIQSQSSPNPVSHSVVRVGLLLLVRLVHKTAR